MKSILQEYISKRLSIIDLQRELNKLIKQYNEFTGRYLFIYSVDFTKGRSGIDISLVQDDFYIIQDALRKSEKNKIDFYIETPGGSGEAAEEIARFLRKKFDEVNFVIAGEAKSAGTILALSGDNIYMCETGSLGPIDAQVKMGRSVVSAHDYKAWVDEKRNEANSKGVLNTFDAIMVAQISPGEIYGVVNSLEFAKDLVKGWLEKYKFKNWTETQTKREKVTDKMRKQRAEEVANKLCNHMAWRTHGRSLKIEDLKDDLLIENIDSNQKLADIVYRIKAVTMLIFDSSTNYKLYVGEDFLLYRTATSINTNLPQPLPPPPGALVEDKHIDMVEIDARCAKCGENHKIKGYFGVVSREQIKKLNLPENKNVRDDDILICDKCKFETNLKPLKNHLETISHKKVTF
ncbi:MAG: ATP-dependent Clp protease proteolytic subunit [Prevotellaceae bacterium]|jgi:hypothetical protein|nr:ATP-dependent Clp protease proteolytic subunit [Prevotellaceae bacterium]